MNILIILNGSMGDISGIKDAIKSYDYIICADGGARYAYAGGIIPDVILGDFDSLPEDILEYYKTKDILIKTYPKEKDETDSQIAVDMAISMGADRVTLIGALGSRLDHSYANIMLLCRLKNHGIDGCIIDSNNIITVSNDVLIINGEIGGYVSLLPLGEDTYIEYTKGLRYPIFDKKLPLDFPYGISNEFIENTAMVKIISGWVVAIKATD
ncbi:thiamine diphosphokinase [Xylanivirga thermophila]|uniref:thiamine diphosphokinase n=1 Tax=Xylanivirga thermophila TaxID=2496273 RepID=UPI0013EA7CEA|nr:thiamine diphosphokinase [Xylanivirga thermophila]